MAITAVAAYCWRRRPYLLVGWLWFLGMLVPVIGLVQFVRPCPGRPLHLSESDRFVDRAGLGRVERLSVATMLQPVRWRTWMLAVVSGGAVLVLAAVAWRQTSYWRNSETLWTHALACTEQNVPAHYNLAYLLHSAGKNRRSDAPISAQALAADSIDRMGIARSHGLSGDCLASQGKTDEALAQYEQAVRVIPTAPMFHDRLAIALAGQGLMDRAIAEWRETVRLVPSYLDARLALANALLSQGDSTGAIAECREVLKQNPTSVAALVIQGAALVNQGKFEEALPDLERALQLEPENAQAHFRLGLAQLPLGGWKVPPRISTRPCVFSPTMSPCCGKRPGFWPRVRSPRFVTVGGRSNCPAEPSGFRAAARRTPSMRWRLGWPKSRSSQRQPTQPSKVRHWPWHVATRHWPTPSKSGQSSTARNCRIASRRRKTNGLLRTLNCPACRRRPSRLCAGPGSAASCRRLWD